jgi:glyoxylase-like metal-dependent hydrolase (beta-lactamase superfamily II)
MQTITKGFYYQDAYAGVILGAVVLPHGTLLIDSPLRPEEARSWKSSVLTQSRGTHRLLVTLDSHIDRTLGNRYLDLTTIAHNDTGIDIETRSNVFKGQNTETGSEWENYPETLGTRWADPIFTFKDHLALHWGDHEIHLDHRPGPNTGSIWVEIPSERIIFIGDTVVVNQPPFLANADIPLWLESLSLLRSRKYRNYTMISGRSGEITTDDIKNQQALFKSILGRMDTIARKKTLPENTEKLIPNLLSRCKFPQKNTTFYTQRLRHGLLNYFIEHYSPDELSQED